MATNNEDGKIWTTTQRPNVTNNQDGQIRTTEQRDGVAVITRSFGVIIG